MAERETIIVRPDYWDLYWRRLLNAVVCCGILWCACNAVFSSHTPAFSHLSMSGPITTKWMPSSRKVSLNVGKIFNDGNADSGDLKLEMWACDKPYDGGVIKGERLASIDLKDQLGPEEFYNPASYTLNVTLPKKLDQPEAITVALFEKKDGKETIVSATDLKAKYVFRSDEWLHWYERVPAWGWLGALLAVIGLAGGIVFALRMRASRE